MIDLCIMFGGRSSEYEVSCVSAYSVISNSDRNKYNITTLGVTKNGEWYIYEGDPEKIRDLSWSADRENMKKCHLSLSYGDRNIYTKDGKIPVDVVFPVMHGTNVEDGKMQGALSLTGIPFVGCKVTSSALTFDKEFTKETIRSLGIRQARSVCIKKSDYEKDSERIIDNIKKEFSLPLFVKPANAGSSVGVHKVKSEEELDASIKDALIYDSKALIEEYIKGKELEVAVFGNDDPVASAVGEIDPGFEFYDYATKYETSTAKLYIPARISDDISDCARSAALKIFKHLGCSGLARVDFLCDEKGVVFNEINSMPGFTPISMYPKLMMHTFGMTYPELIDGLVKLALEDKG